MSSQLPWFVARAAGLISWGLLATSVLWGLALSTRAMRKWAKPAWVLDLHRFLAGLTVIFVAIHVVAIMLDSYVHFGLADVLVPLAASWHPVGVAWGIAGLYLLAAVELTSLLRSRLPRKLWRRMHYASLPLFVAATAHGFSTGTDRANMAVIFAGAAGVVAAAVLVGRRLSRGAAGTSPGAAVPGRSSSGRSSSGRSSSGRSSSGRPDSDRVLQGSGR